MKCLLFVLIEAGEESPSSLSPPPDGGSNEWVFLPPNFHNTSHNSGSEQIKMNRLIYSLLYITSGGGGRGRGNVAQDRNLILIAQKRGLEIVNLVSSAVIA